ncbi:hypothetical protein N656DRAFT_91729 [Canariomyces notabilis]|uniref:Uncharacterized protein n=1 Tax=Canariomyces notabilis TaxID=2074819 RepID=A0AAN6TDR9_9PEZI|nr:hypothetical protein N656DRAFT_91729 [Canariomyces arenarius]
MRKQDLIAELVVEIKKTRAQLQCALDDHAGEIATRWKKRSREKRERLLKSVSALHPEEHGIRLMVPDRVEPDQRYRVYNSVNSTAKKYLDTWLAPWLDIKALSESPLDLLALLHYRVSYHPADWVMFDYRLSDTARIHGLLGRHFNRQAVRLTQNGFGRLVGWNKTQMHRHECFGFDAAIYILTTAQRIFKILVGVVEDLLIEIQQRAEKHAQTDLVSSTNPSTSTNQSSSIWESLVRNKFTSFGVRNRGVAPRPRTGFTHPEPMTLEELREIILARYNASSDELKLIQSNAEYVNYLVTVEFSESFARPFLNDKGMWTFKAQDILVQPLLDNLLCGELLSIIQRLGDCSTAVTAGKRNVREREVLFSFLSQACAMSQVIQLSQLHSSVTQERNLGYDQVQNPEYHIDFRVIDPFLSAISTLGHDEGCDAPLPLCLKLDFIHKCLAVNPGARERVTSRFLKRIADISTTADAALSRLWVSTSSLLQGMLRKSKLSGSLVQHLMATLFSGAGGSDGSGMDAGPVASGSQGPEVPAGPAPAVQGDFNPSAQEEAKPASTQGPLQNVETHSLWDEMMAAKHQGHPGEAVTPSTITTPRPTGAALPKPVPTAHTQIPVSATGRVVLPSDSYRLIQQMLGAAQTRAEAQAKHRWPKFVTAMEDAGFTAYEGPGSAITFRAPDGKGCISFHRPHPDATLFPVLLRAFGRRMANWFGWKAEDFVEEASLIRLEGRY